MKNSDSIFKAFFGGDGNTLRHSPRDLEHRLQCACVRWFRLAYPQYHHNLFAVPNGGYRTKTTAANMKAEGQLSGVSDLILLKRKGKCGALLLEAKIKGNYQSDNQREWQRRIEADGYEYRIFHSLDEFIAIITEYLNRPDE
jgi:hypothetical protein